MKLNVKWDQEGGQKTGMYVHRWHSPSRKEKIKRQSFKSR